jgi:hypothetical protein
LDFAPADAGSSNNIRKLYSIGVDYKPLFAQAQRPMLLFLTGTPKLASFRKELSCYE